MAFTNSWDETAPLGSALISTVDDVIRQLKLDLRERLAGSSAELNSGRMRIQPAAASGLTASTEVVDVLVDLAHTLTFLAGAITTERAIKITPPTYAFASSSTITTAVTLALTGPPVAGANATITNLFTLMLEAGNMSLPAGGYLNFGATSGSGGYGIRESSGVVEVKNSTGGWGAIAPVGAVTAYVGATAPSGWLLLAGQTIGDASSSGTARANADTEALFTLLWDSMADAEAPVSTGRGASAAADFAAHKTITLPDLRGRVIAGQDDMGGTSANRMTSAIDGDVLGKAGGEETHTLTEAEMPSHTHAPGSSYDGFVQWDQHSSALSWTADGPGPLGATGMSAAGSSSAHNNMQPTLVLNYIIKY